MGITERVAAGREITARAPQRVPDQPCIDCLDDLLATGGGRPAVPRRVAFWLLAAVLTATMLGTTLPTPLYVIYQAQWRFSSAIVTVTFAAYAAGVLAALLLAGRALTAFFTGAATALGAGVSMAFSEGLSDTGDLTGRGSPILRGAITGGGTFLGGIFHALPFLIPGFGAAISLAIAVVATELLTLAYLRHKFFQTSFARSFLAVAVGGAIIASLSAGLGVLAAG
jgi:erythrin-vacuolar iron transport family protein